MRPCSCLVSHPGYSEILRLRFCPHETFAGADSSRAHTTSVSIIFHLSLLWKIKVTICKMSEVMFLAVVTSQWGCFSVGFPLNFVFTPPFLIHPSIWLRLISESRLMSCLWVEVCVLFCILRRYKSTWPETLFLVCFLSMHVSWLFLCSEWTLHSRIEYWQAKAAIPSHSTCTDWITEANHSELPCSAPVCVWTCFSVCTTTRVCVCLCLCKHIKSNQMYS